MLIGTQCFLRDPKMRLQCEYKSSLLSGSLDNGQYISLCVPKMKLQCKYEENLCGLQSGDLKSRSKSQKCNPIQEPIKNYLWCKYGKPTCSGSLLIALISLYYI